MTVILPDDVPGEAVAEDGFVLLDGPGGAAVSMTAEVAEETGRRLIAAAADARRQRQERAG